MRHKSQRTAAFLAALILALCTAVTGALSAPKAAADDPPTSRKLLVPPGIVPSRAQLQQFAQEFISDPLGRVGFQAWTNLRLHRYNPQNISAGLFRFDWMPADSELPAWIRDDPEDFLTALNQEVQAPSSQPAKDYPLLAQLRSGDSELYDRLGMTGGSYNLDFEPYGDPLLEVETGSAWSGHSEQNMVEWLKRTFGNALFRMARPAQRGDIAKAVKTLMAKSGAGFVGPRSMCDMCEAELNDEGVRFQHELAIVDYDKEKSPQAARAQQILTSGLFSMLQAEYTKEEAEAPAQADSNLDLPQAAQPCTPVNPAGQLSMATVPLAAPCGGSEGNGSALGQALGSQTYGGVDFSTVQLRYMSDSPGTGVRYAFSGKAAAPGLTQDLDSARDALTQSTADLRTWLVLSPDKFWVNLNPTEPDRIVDPELGRTDAGRALLEADLGMKKTEGRMLNPDTPFGAEYWDKIAGPSGKVCYSSRLWIVPGDVEVRQEGSSLYVLKAALDVKAKAQQVNGLGQTECNADPVATARNEQLEQTMVVPRIVQAVNTAPEYAPIRRAFLARVVAQWIRDRHQQGHSTSFDKLIDSGDLGPAQLQNSWRPQQVYDSYLKSIKDGDFTYKRTVRSGNTLITYVMTTGGVDFSKLDPQQISAAQMNQSYPGLAQTAQSSTSHPVSASDGSMWLGESTGAQHISAWSRITSYAGGRTGLLVVLVVALGAVTFLIREGSPIRRRARGKDGGRRVN